MADLNRLCLCGNVGKDPEIKTLNSGKIVANFTLATNEKWKDKSSGETVTNTEWTNVVVYNERLAEIIEQYIQKGTRLYVEGKKITRKWTDNEGNDRYSTELVISGFDGRVDIQGNARSQDQAQRPAPQPQQPPAAPDFDDDFPF